MTPRFVPADRAYARRVLAAGTGLIAASAYTGAWGWPPGSTRTCRHLRTSCRCTARRIANPVWAVAAQLIATFDADTIRALTRWATAATPLVLLLTLLTGLAHDARAYRTGGAP